MERLFNSEILIFSTGKQCFTVPKIKNGFVVDSEREYFFDDEARVSYLKMKMKSFLVITKCEIYIFNVGAMPSWI